jgi:hypothetical protein
MKAERIRPMGYTRPDLGERIRSSFSRCWSAILDPRTGIRFDLAVLFAVGTFTLAVHYQGWRGAEQANLDMLPYYEGAWNFLHQGTIPQKGEISSYFSYNPPGTWIFMVPGLILTPDPRLQTLPGTAILLYATLIFLYLLLREIGGRGIALAGTAVFGLSRLGFIGLWPVGHPAFILGPLYFLLLWVKHRRPWMLAVSLSIFVFGLYVDLAILPFLFVYPVIWVLFRPPLGWKGLLGSAAVGALIWFPYLYFESGRGFVDLASLLLLRPVDSVLQPSAVEPLYCYSALPGENDEPNDLYLPFVGGSEIEARVVYPLAGWKNQAAYRICRVLLNADRNFDTDLFAVGVSRGLNTALWFVFLAGWSALGWTVLRVFGAVGRFVELGRTRPWLPLVLAAAGGSALYLLLNPALIANFTADKNLDRNMALVIRQLQEFLPLVWIALGAGWFIAARPDRRPDRAVLWIAFSLPWLIIVALAEPGRPERFWFLWPLQVAILVLGLRWLADRLPRPGPAFAAQTVFLAAAVLPLPLIGGHLADARSFGYAGADNPQWQVVEFLAGKAGPGGEIPVAYLLGDSADAAGGGCTGYSLASWFDYQLLHPFGVTNSAACAPPAGPHWEVVERAVAVPPELADATPEATFGHYVVYLVP